MSRLGGSRANSWFAAGLVALVALTVTSCASGNAHHHLPTTTLTYPTTPSGPTTTTSPPPVLRSVLEPRLLTLSSFPAGWTSDSAAGAADTTGSPACVQDPVLMKGSLASLSSVFTGPTPPTPPDAAVQAVGLFANNAQAVASVKFEHQVTYTCDANLTGVSMAIVAVPSPTQQRDGYARQLVFTKGTGRAIVDEFYAINGRLATALVWKTSSTDTTAFTSAINAAYSLLGSAG